jgi:nitrogen regulatory protein PII
MMRIEKDIVYIFRESIMILVERASEDEVYKVINLIARLSIQSKVVDSCIYILPPQQPTNVRTITCHC